MKQPTEFGPKTLVLDRAEAHAIKALAEGKAGKDQQKLALDWIIYKAAGLAVSQFFSGAEDGRRDTDFMTGRAFTGQQILSVIKADMDTLGFKPKEATDK